MPSSNVKNVIYTNPSSGLSYTNKDFNSIYSEELDLVKSISPKWDPTISNESDPGVVLLKENAIIADKENYNIDKNILETFPLSVSQVGNARQIYDSLGYEMKWYRAASTQISYKYNGELTIGGTGTNFSSGIKIPRFTMVTDSTGEYVYTLTDPSVIMTRNEVYTSPSLQGVIQNLVIGGSDIISLNNLDDDLRVYIPDTMVAENGIFVANTNEAQTEDSDLRWDAWKRVSNIESYQTGQRVYSFGVLPNSGTCYIQFPEDISDIIKSGLKIKYIVTMGESGNIQNNVIDSFYTNVEITDDGGNDQNLTENLIVFNPFDAVDGEDPELLEDAYRNYKKTVGTFNTLVTCRDYENAVYNLQENGKYLASNAVAADRTNDIEYSYHVVTMDQDSVDKKLVVDTTGRNAFNLALYILSPYDGGSKKVSYDASFSVNQNYQVIEQGIEELKSLQHDYVGSVRTANYPFCIKNFYDVNGKVITYYKVSNQDAREIETNIKTALYRKYNARKVNFGEPISYDDIIQTINNADTRIKSVILNEPTYTAKIMWGDDTSGSFDNATDLVYNSSASEQEDENASNFYKHILQSLILNGNVQMYQFDDRFVYKFGQKDIKVFDNISKIKTKVTIPATLDATDNKYKINNYPIKKNERVFVSRPEYIVTYTYSYMMYYKMSGADDNIPPNTYFKTGDGSNGIKLLLKWTDSSGVPRDVAIAPNTICYSNMELINGAEDYTGMGTTGAIYINKPNSVELEMNPSVKEDRMPCYWLRNNTENVLFEANQESIMLEEGEYFLYSKSDDLSQGIAILGSSTLIKRDLSVDSSEVVPENKSKSKITAEKILSGDAEEIQWQHIREKLDIQEMNLTALGEGCHFSGTITTTGAHEINNDPVSVNNISAKDIGGEDIDFMKLDSSVSDTIDYQAWSRLNINSTGLLPQQLLTNQSFTFTLDDPDNPGHDKSSAESPITGNDTTPVLVQFNANLVLAGGENIDVRVMQEDGTFKAELDAISYTLASGLPNTDSSGYYIIEGNGTPTKLSINRMDSSLSWGDRIVFTIFKQDEKQVTISGVSEIRSQYGAISNPSSITNHGTYYAFINNSAGSPLGNTIQVTITNPQGAEELLIGNVNIIERYTQILRSGNDTLMGGVETFIKRTMLASPYSPNVAYNWTNRVNEAAAVENPMTADSFWDSNNPFNRFTIAQMNNCNVSVINSSRL